MSKFLDCTNILPTHCNPNSDAYIYIHVYIHPYAIRKNVSTYTCTICTTSANIWTAPTFCSTLQPQRRRLYIYTPIYIHLHTNMSEFADGTHTHTHTHSLSLPDGSKPDKGAKPNITSQHRSNAAQSRNNKAEDCNNKEDDCNNNTSQHCNNKAKDCNNKADDCNNNQSRHRHIESSAVIKSCCSVLQCAVVCCSVL